MSLAPTQHPTLPAATTVGTVRLTVRDMARARDFYERVLGLTSTEFGDGGLALSTGGAPLVALHEDPAAAPLRRRATGLFHLALLYPDRRALAAALARLAHAGWRLDGASDHLVSEALYLSDPDGNGIELYRDRPHSQWRRHDGELQMSTLPLDLDDLVSEVGDIAQPSTGAPAGTRMGHVHLQVGDLRAAEQFYAGVLGFDVIVRGYPGALFVSAGGYHHHLGLNIWNSAGSGPPPPGSVGLRSYDVVLPDGAARDATLARVREAGLPVAESPHGPLIRDPSGNGVVLAVA